MPKLVDYPRASLPQALELAAAVEQLGGDCAAAAAAGLTGHRLGGTFTALAAAAAKYGWITARRSRLRTTPAYRDYRLAGDDATRRQVLCTALLCPPLFARLARRFAGKPLPEGALPGLLVREFGVPEAIAPRVAGYFVAGARLAGLLDGANLKQAGETEGAAEETLALQEPPARARPPGSSAPARTKEPGFGTGVDDVRERPDTAAWRETVAERPAERAREPADYRLRLSGPGMDLALSMRDAADVALARALLDRVEAALAGDARSRSVDE